MLEGSRAFDIAWGTGWGSVCFAIGIVAIALWVAARRSGAPSMFGPRLDPGRGLQLAWGIFAMGMGGTNFGCRFIDHRYLSGVHEGFFALTLIVVAVMLPALARFALRAGRANAQSSVAA